MNINKVYYLILIFAFSIQTIYTQNKYEFTKTDSEWKSQLDELSYLVLRKAYTERPYSGKYDNFYEKGIYHCAGCDEPLYKSSRKYNSYCGWPSFDKEINNKLEYDVEYKLGYPRTEIKCKKCGGHLGHVFKDGPKETTGIRHCVNSVALFFKKAGKKKIIFTGGKNLISLVIKF